MHNEYLKDLFTEGLGDIFFMKYYKFINNKVKNKVIKKLLIGLHIVFYIIFLIAISLIMFRLSFPL